VAVDGNGDGLALIQDTASGSLVARRFLAASGWQAPTSDEDLSAGGVIDSDDADLAVARFGDAIATWIVDDNVFASRYEVGAGWQAGELIFDGTGFNTQEVGAAISNNGEAFVHWYLTAGTIQSVRSLRYTESGGWDATFAVVANSLGNSPNVTADATMDSFGNVTVVWQNVGNDVFARRYLVGFGWQDSTLLDNLPSSGILGGSQPRIAGDLFGNAAVVWSGGSNIETIRFTPGSGWGTADIIDTEALPTRDPVVSMNPEGDVVAAWWQAGDAWSALFR
ncbi:MAG: hypothetical protein MI724_03820, partial [Spirochaetales bacterium]|nr:hypothetical protein [Spirochaetales bacterium]